MDAKDLRIAQLEAAALAHQQRAAQLQQQLTEASVQHQAVIAQYQELLAKRERKIAEQDFDMKRLLKSLRGSRQNESIQPRFCCFLWRSCSS
jgi:hypothetical protein